LGASIVTVVRVDRFAAFSVNGVGLERAPFPLSISVALPSTIRPRTPDLIP
jgi:hypothetical protein